MSRLLEMPDTSSPLGRRDRAILELFYASGLRLSELVGLGLEDVNLSSRVVRVLGKGGKERIVPFNRSTEAAIRAWLNDREVLIAGIRDPGSGVREPDPGSGLAEIAKPAEISARLRAAVSELPGRAAIDAQCRSAGQEVRRRVQHAVRDQPACAAALVRDAPARTRRGSAGDPGIARSCAPEHHAALHARERRAVDRRLSEGPSEGLSRRMRLAVSP